MSTTPATPTVCTHCGRGQDPTIPVVDELGAAPWCAPCLMVWLLPLDAGRTAELTLMVDRPRVKAVV